MGRPVTQVELALASQGDHIYVCITITYLVQYCGVFRRSFCSRPFIEFGIKLRIVGGALAQHAVGWEDGYARLGRRIYWCDGIGDIVGRSRWRRVCRG